MTSKTKTSIINLTKTLNSFSLDIPELTMIITYAGAPGSYHLAINGNYFDRMSTKNEVIKKLEEVL